MNNKIRFTGVLALIVLLCAAVQPVAFAGKDKKKKKSKTENIQSFEPGSNLSVTDNKPKDTAANIGSMVLPLDPAVRTGTLANGLKYYIRKNNKPENRVEMRLAVNVGSNQENEDQKGLAHFVEHMAFNGSEHFAKNDLVNFLEGVGVKFGAHLNAYTSFDETVYMLQLPADKKEVLDKGLLVLQDWAGGLTFDHNEIDKERGVVVSEWRNGLGPAMRMLYKWLPTYYYQSRYAERLPIGDTAILKNAAYDRFTSFYKDWYRPDLMAVMIVGDVNVDSMEAEIKKRFAALKNPEKPRVKEEYPLPGHEKTLVSIATDPEATYTTLYLMHKHKADNPETLNGYRNYIMNALMNNMLNLRLAEIAQQPDPPFLQANSSYGPETRLNDAFSSAAYIKTGKTKEALQVMLTENERVKRYGFTQTELDLAKIAWMKGLEDALKEKDKTESSQLVTEYVKHYLEQIPAPGIETEYNLSKEMVPFIQLSEINEKIKGYISNSNRVVVIAAPEQEKKFLPWENEVLEMVAAAEKAEIKAYEDKVSTAPLFSAQLKNSPIVNISKTDSFNITTYVLGNGVRIIVKPTDFKNDEILFTAYSPGGTSLYADSNYMSADYSNYIVMESGIAEFDKMTLQKMLVGKTVNVGPYVDELKEGFNGSCAPADLETLLQLVNLYFTQPRKSPDDFASLMAKEHGQYDYILDNPQYYFLDKVQRVIYNNSIRKGLPIKEKLDRVNFETAFKIYTERFSNAADFTFVFVGNVDTNKLKPLVQSYLGSLPTNTARETWKDPGITKPNGQVQSKISMGNTPKTLVALHFHDKAVWSEQDEYEFNSMVKVLSITLRESLREDKGGVYGVGVNGVFSRRPVERYGVTVQFNADPLKADELIQLVYSQIDELKNTGTTEEKINKVKETQRRERETDIKENAFWLGSIEYYDTYNTDIKNLSTYLARVDKLTAQDIQKAAKKFLGGQNRVEVILSPKAE